MSKNQGEGLKGKGNDFRGSGEMGKWRKKV
jgi:hypothetical protein